MIVGAGAVAGLVIRGADEPAPDKVERSYGAVAWIDAPGYIDRALPTRVCKGADIAARLGAWRLYRGSMAQIVVLTSGSGDDCALTLEGPIRTASAEGEPPPVAMGAFRGATVALRPDLQVLLPIGTLGCDQPAREAVEITVRLGPDTVRRLSGARLPVRCDLQVQNFVAEPLPTSTLELAMHAAIEHVDPAVVGDTTRFTVVLTNADARRASLSPCPSYQVDIEGTDARQVHLLNCPAIMTLIPGESVSMEMRLDVPDTVEPGDYELRWALDGYGAADSAPIEVRSE